MYITIAFCFAENCRASISVNKRFRLVDQEAVCLAALRQREDVERGEADVVDAVDVVVEEAIQSLSLLMILIVISRHISSKRKVKSRSIYEVLNAWLFDKRNLPPFQTVKELLH